MKAEEEELYDYLFIVSAMPGLYVLKPEQVKMFDSYPY
jgi:hypothetical protein